MTLINFIHDPQSLLNLGFIVVLLALWNKVLACDKEKLEIWRQLIEVSRLARLPRPKIPKKIQRKLNGGGGSISTVFLIALFLLCFCLNAMAQTAVPSPAQTKEVALEAQSYLDGIHDLQSDGFILVTTIVTGYCARRFKFIPNGMLYPTAMFTGLLYLGMIPWPWVPFLPTFIREGLYGLMLGMIGGLVASALHDKLGKYLAQRWPVLGFIICEEPLSGGNMGKET